MSRNKNSRGRHFQVFRSALQSVFTLLAVALVIGYIGYHAVAIFNLFKNL